MKEDLACRLVSRLNGYAFVSYVDKLFSEWYGNCKKPTSFSHFEWIKKQKDVEIDPNIFQVLIEDKWGPPTTLFNFYNIYIPQLVPVDLLKDPKKINVGSPSLKKELEKIFKRYLLWDKDILPNPEADFASNVGDVLEGIYFLTNFAQISKKDYYRYIIPKYEKLVNQIGMAEGTVGVGSPDSFFDRDSKTAKKILEEFLAKNIDGICISLPLGEDPRINSFVSEKYLVSGVSKQHKLPSESVFINKKQQTNKLIAEFESLIASTPSEREIESFLKAHYKEIFGLQYDRIETQLWLRFPELDIRGKHRRLDIFLRNSLMRDWELFEIKAPIVKMTGSYRDIPVLTNEISKSIQQLHHYGDILKQEKVRKRLAMEGIKYYEPELRLVVGRKPQIPLKEWRFLLKKNQNNLKIMTYDDLLEEMKLRFDDRIKIPKNL